MNKTNRIELILKLTCAVIMLQTLYFKFTAHPDSVYIFTRMGLEPQGRILLGCLELMASLGLFVRRTSVFAMILTLGMMSGALLSHIFVLGIIVNNDHGQLFGLALLVWISSAALIYIKKEYLLKIFSWK